MAQPRKPTAVLEFTGAFKHEPGRRRERAAEPVPDGPLGGVPPHLPADVATCWERLVAMAPARVLCNCDEVAVEVAARLMAKAREPDCTIAALTALRIALRELGMTPASRSLVSATPLPYASGQSTGDSFADI